MLDESSVARGLKEFKAKHWFLALVAIVLAADISILIDLPFFRQVLGFLCFTIIPGLLVLYVLKLREMSFLKKLALSIGLSLVFLIFSALLINTLLPLIGYTKPLSTVPLLVTFNILIAILFFFAYRRNRNDSLNIGIPRLIIGSRKLLLSPLLFPILFPLLAVIGTHLMNLYGNNTILLINLYLIPIYVILLIFFHKRVPRATYPVALVMIGMALLLQRGLTSNYLIGGDIYTEYAVFQSVSTNMHWNISANPAMTYASLGITILPTVLNSLININPLYIYKAVSLVLISISPLIAYCIYERHLGAFYAFLASFFLMAQLPFMYLLTGQIRVGIALVFLLCAMLVLLDDNLPGLKRNALFLAFVASLVCSYYITPVILFALLAIAWLLQRILRALFQHPVQASQSLRLPIVVLLGTLIFLWWAQITPAGFEGYVDFMAKTASNLGNLFAEGLRGTGVTRMYDFSGTLLPDKITAIFNDISFVLIGIGILSCFLIKTLRQKYSLILRITMFSALILLGAIIILPFVSVGYGPDRFYLQVMALVAPGFIVGCEILSRITRKRLSLVIIGLVLIPLFFCNSRLVYDVSGYPKSEVYNTGSQARIRSYVYESEVAAASWLARYNIEDLPVYIGSQAQPFSGDVFEFTSHGVTRKFPVYSFERLKFIEEREPSEQNFVFLKHANVVDKQVFGAEDPDIPPGGPAPLEKYSYLYSGRDRIYTTGDTEIYK